MVGNGFRIGTIRGIPIRVDITFLLVLPFLAFGFARAFREAAALASVPPEMLQGGPFWWGLAVALALFASVLLHELAHALYAQRKGGKVEGITLLMIGGVTQVVEAPRAARHEAVMALVGPVVSILLGAVFWLIHLAMDQASFNLRFAFFYLGSLNLVLGVFNLLPAFPMDGGRILRAVLVPRYGPVRATNIAARVGKVFAILFAIWGFVTFNMLQLLIAFFVYTGAEAETRAMMVKALLGGLHVRDLMTPLTPGTAAISDEDPVQRAVERMVAERLVSLIVTHDEQPVGVVTLDAVRGVPPEARAAIPIREVMVLAKPLSPDDDAVTALQMLRDLPQLAVVEDGQLVGVVTRDEIVRRLKLSELEATHRGRTRWVREEQHARP
jgi:Zn-dependent protease